jgi:hypothetical protein
MGPGRPCEKDGLAFVRVLAPDSVFYDDTDQATNDSSIRCPIREGGRLLLFGN